MAEAMKMDNQHLDFLISQYVDGVLDAPNRKLIEGELAVNETARGLLREHQEVQEVLEEWGGRIPMIDWANFDRQLAERLVAEEAAAVRPAAWWPHWARPMAVAAALLAAAIVGYSWHAWSTGEATTPTVAKGPAIAAPERLVKIVDEPVAAGNSRMVTITDFPGEIKKMPETVAERKGVQVHEGLGATPGNDKRPAERIVRSRPAAGSVTADAPTTQAVPDDLR